MIRRLLNKIESIYQYRYFSNVEDGAYKFLLKNVYKSTDVDFLENLWQLDYFRNVLIPKPIPLNGIKKVLVLAPHQDDEAIGCGGTLLKLKDLKVEIEICFLTNGAELSNLKDSVYIRDRESSKICEVLNAKKHNLGIDNVKLNISDDHINKLVGLLKNDWDLIFTIWPIDNPPKHRLCSYILGLALHQSNYKGQLALYTVHTALLPNVYVDISDEIDKKQMLIELYQSQLKNQNYAHLSKGLSAWNSKYLEVSSKARFIETFMQIPAIAYTDFQEVYRKSNLNKLFKGHETCINSFKKLNNSFH
ncbi:PIG-L deacetylase family protein [Winogradskyella sp.]|uniref:PIG-L deacetylase family protein n=1 Tax=Winogradskyella sp. TaxID=1883156 RepID=UPI0026358414|nr:PIG-L deacetylase family protein [Winogradskyella sp.]